MTGKVEGNMLTDMRTTSESNKVHKDTTKEKNFRTSKYKIVPGRITLNKTRRNM
jgi:ribosomal protein S18